MNKRRITKALAKAPACIVAELAAPIRSEYQPLIVNKPSKALAMIKMREPVKQSQFYLGEVVVYEAAVEIDGVGGMAVSMTDEQDKILDMAIIDAAINKGVFADMEALEVLENHQHHQAMQLNALHLKTMVNFESMDGEAPDDLAASQKA